MLNSWIKKEKKIIDVINFPVYLYSLKQKLANDIVMWNTVTYLHFLSAWKPLNHLKIFVSTYVICVAIKFSAHELVHDCNVKICC